MAINIKIHAESEDIKRLIGSFFSLTLLRGLQFLIPLITLPYLIRTIGIEKFGLVNFALSLGIYFGAIIQFGFSVTATREIARHRHDGIKIAKIYSETLVASLILAAISTILYFILLMLFEKLSSNLRLYLFTLGAIVFQSLFPVWFFQGMEKMKYITILSFGSSVMYLFGIFAFVKKQDDYEVIPFLNAIAAFLILVLAITLIRINFKVHFTYPKIIDLKAVYKDGYHSFIIQMAPNFYNNSTVFFLGLFTNNSLVGVYTAALKVIDAFMSLAQILTNSFLPYLARDLSKHRIFLKIMGLSGLISTVAVLLFAEKITELLYGNADDSISMYLKLLSPWILMIFLRNALGVNYLMLTGHERQYKNIILYASLLALGLSLMIIPILEIMGAVLIINITALLMLFFTVALYIRVKNEKN